jgi:hemolysin activation/secretion protein
LPKLRLSIALLFSLMCAAGMAQVPDKPIVFAISGYQVVGNTLLSAQQIEQATQRFVMPQANFDTIQQALEALEKTYVSAGFGLVRVELPEQEIAAGVVTLRVVEGVLSDIHIEPNAYFDDDNVRRSLPALRLGESVNIQTLNRNLTLVNESGFKVSNVTFKRNDSNNREVAADVKLAAERPQRWLALADNTGNAATGRLRTGLVYQNGNVFNRDHSLSLQVMTSPDHLSDVRILGLGYRVPLYALGDVVDFSASSSNVDSGQVRGAGGGPDLSISGSGLMLGLRYTHYLEATAEQQPSWNIGLEHRAYGNSVTTSGGQDSLVPDLTTHPLTLGYSSRWRSDKRDVSASITWLKNLPGGSHGSSADFNLPGGRSGANASFQTLKFDFQHTERFESQWSLHSALSGQLTRDLLIAAEQFGVGGADSVRGFDEREVAGDQGLRAGIEVWSPPYSADPWRMIGLVFVDLAHVSRNQPAAGEVSSQNVSSAGLGLRAAYGRNLNLRADWGYVLKGVNGISGPAKSDQKLHVSAVWAF